MAGPLVETVIRIRSQYDPVGTTAAKADVASLGSGIARAGQAASLLSNRFRTAALVLGGAAAGTVVAFAQVQKAQVSLQRVSGLQGAQFQDLTDKLKAMAPTLGETQTGILDLATSAARLGLEGKDLAGFVGISSKAAIALNADVGETSTTLATLKRSMGLTVDQVGKLTGAIIALDNVSGSTFQMTTAAMLTTGNSAKVLGIPAQNLAALSAAITSTGVSSEVAGTALSQLFFTIQRRSEKLAPLFGMTGDQLRRAFQQDQIGTIVKISDAFTLMLKNGQNTDQFFKALGLSGRRVGQVIASIGGQQDRLNQLMAVSNKEYAQGTLLQKYFGAQAETITFKFEQLKSNFLAAAAAIGEKLAPVVTKIIDGLSTLFNIISKSPVLTFAIGMGLVGGAIGAAVMFLKFFATSQLIAFDIARTSLPLVTGQYAALATSIRAAALAQAEMGPVGSGLLGNLASGLKGAPGAVMGFLKGIRPAWALREGNAAVQATGMEGLFGLNVGAVRAVGLLGSVGEGFQVVLGLASRFALPVTIAVGAFDALSKNTYKCRDALMEMVKPFTSIFGGSGGKAMGGLSETLKSITDILGGVIGMLITIAAKILTPVFQTLKFILDRIFDVVNFFIGPIKGIVDSVANVLGVGTNPTYANGVGTLPTVAAPSPVTAPKVATAGATSYMGSYDATINFNNVQVRSQADIDAIRTVVNQELQKAAARAR